MNNSIDRVLVKVSYLLLSLSNRLDCKALRWLTVCVNPAIYIIVGLLSSRAVNGLADALIQGTLPEKQQ